MEQIKQLVNKLETAWNAGDHVAWASAFAPDADFINIFGAYKNGQANIEASHKIIFNGIYKDSHNTFTIERVRVLAPHVTSVLIFTKLTHKDGGHDGRMTMIVDDSSGTPLITWFHNCFVMTPKHRADEPDPGQARRPLEVQ